MKAKPEESTSLKVWLKEYPLSCIDEKDDSWSEDRATLQIISGRSLIFLSDREKDC